MKSEKRNIMRNLAYLGIVISPIAATISCGSDVSDPDKLTLSMRAEDVDFWKPIMESFKKKTGIKVTTRLVSDQKQDYATWEGTDSLPDILLADQNTAKDAMKDSKWLDPINLTELKKAEYDVVNLTPKEFDFENSNNYHVNKVFGAFKTGDHNVISLPYGYGAQGIYINKNNIDMGKPLKAYVPKDDGSFAEHVVIPAGEVTIDNLKQFVANAGKDNTNDEIKLGQGKFAPKDSEIDSEIKEKESDSNLTWYDYGSLAMYQRLGSIGRSLAHNDKAGWIKDIGFPFEIIASLGDNIYSKGKIQDKKLKEKFPITGNLDPNYMKQLYQAYFGYFKTVGTGYATNPKAQGVPGEADALWSGKGNIMLGYKWQSGMISSNWYAKSKGNAEKYDDAIEIIPAPYGSVGIDSLGVAKGLSEAKKINVYKFLRFALDESDTTNALKITGDKVFSPVVAAENTQKEEINRNTKLSKNEKSRHLAFFNSSTGIEYNGVSGAIISNSTDGIYDIYNGVYGGDSGLKSALTGSNIPNNLKKWTEKFKSVLKEVWDEISIREIV